MKILIVDNDVNVVETLKAALALKKEYDIEIAYSGGVALEKMKAGNKYDLIILDIMMPEISGIDVCQFMARDKALKNTAVLLISALPVSSKEFQDSITSFHDLKVIKGVLEKPFSVENLIKKVEEVIDTKK